MKIIETNLNFGSMSKRSKTNRMIIHHAAAKKASASDIHRWHKQRGWSGAGYHFLVRKDGKVYRLRPEKYIGAHASGANSDSLGICFEGDFETEKMGDKQKKSGKELVAYLKKKYGISKVQRHKDVGSTSCPGKNFPFSEIAGASGNVTVSTGSAANSAGKLEVDGKWGAKTTKALQKAFGTVQDGKVSNQRQEYRQDGCYTGWEWERNPRGYSDLIKAIQKKVGVKVDGWLGPKTIRAMQKHWGTVQDGKISAVSDLVKALQRWVNKQ